MRQEAKGARHCATRTGAIDARAVPAKPRRAIPCSKRSISARRAAPRDTDLPGQHSLPWRRWLRGRVDWVREAETAAMLQTIDVGTLIEMDFRGAKRWSASDRVYSPIHYVDLAEFADHHVLRFKITMNNVARMGISECVADAPDHPQSLGERRLSPRGSGQDAHP